MMRITQEMLDAADLLVVVDADGNIVFGARRTDIEVINMLRAIADGIEDGSIR